ncbi:MAG TPA: hypothetical protein VGK90_11260, partial [Rhizomicrobium sp.]
AVRCFPAIFSATGWYDGRPTGKGGLLSWIRDNMDPAWEDYDRRLALPGKLLNEILKKNAEKSSIGFKHHLSAPREITDFVMGLQRRKIILTRNNFLAAYSSQKIAELTGQGAARAQSDRPVIKARVEFNREEFQAFCANRTSHYTDARMQAVGLTLEIDYVEARTDKGMAKVAKFLKIDPRGFGPPRTAKRNSDNIVSRFTNKNDAQAYLDENGLADWAKEG